MSRKTAVSIGAVGVLLAAGLAQLSLGPYGVSPSALLGAVLDPNSPDRFVVSVLELPRFAVGALAGTAMGASGAIFQMVTRNPLASPDVMGFGAGAATGAIAALLLGGATSTTATGLALIGGLITAAVVYALAGGLRASPRRLLLCGIMISAALSAVNSYLLLTADVQDTQVVLSWLAGSLNSASWRGAPALGAALVLLLVLTVVYRRALELIEFDDDLVTALGAQAAKLRAGWILLGVLLVAVTTAATGPIAFVALAAPHIARRLNHNRSAGPITAGLIGAALVTTCDAIAANALPIHPPVGIVTGALGGCYLLTLVTRSAPRRLSAQTH